MTEKKDPVEKLDDEIDNLTRIRDGLIRQRAEEKRDEIWAIVRSLEWKYEYHGGCCFRSDGLAKAMEEKGLGNFFSLGPYEIGANTISISDGDPVEFVERLGLKVDLVHLLEEEKKLEGDLSLVKRMIVAEARKRHSQSVTALLEKDAGSEGGGIGEKEGT